MNTEIFTLIFAIIGILSILRFLIFKFITFKEEQFTLLLPVHKENEGIFSRIENLREFLDFSGIHKKCTVVIINYGVSEEFLEKIDSMYGYYGFLKIIDKENAGERLKEIIS
ncbi:MAG: hypothetical protein IKK46_03700 [Clostridia bacterium]|nr:hypothetical protein [Clostridia bacterium]